MVARTRAAYFAVLIVVIACASDATDTEASDASSNAAPALVLINPCANTIDQVYAPVTGSLPTTRVVAGRSFDVLSTVSCLQKK